MAYPTIREAFSLDDAAHRALVPNLMEEIGTRCAAFARTVVQPHVARHGAIPVRVIANDDHAHDAPVFDLFLGSHRDRLADEALRAVEWALHAMSLGPWDTENSRGDRELAALRLLPLAGTISRYGHGTPREIADGWIRDQSSYLADYLGFQTLIEHSDMAATLDELGADHRFEPGRNYLRVIVPDRFAAGIVARTFW